MKRKIEINDILDDCINAALCYATDKIIKGALINDIYNEMKDDIVLKFVPNGQDLKDTFYLYHDKIINAHEKYGFNGDIKESEITLAVANYIHYEVFEALDNFF